MSVIVHKTATLSVVSFAALVASLAWLAEVSGAQTAASKPTPPIDLNRPAEIEAGKAIYDASCSHYCHAPGGAAGLGPALRGRHFDNAYLYMRISNGAPPIPAWGNVYKSK